MGYFLALRDECVYSEGGGYRLVTQFDSLLMQQFGGEVVTGWTHECKLKEIIRIQIHSIGQLRGFEMAESFGIKFFNQGCLLAWGDGEHAQRLDDFVQMLWFTGHDNAYPTGTEHALELGGVMRSEAVEHHIA